MALSSVLVDEIELRDGGVRLPSLPYRPSFSALVAASANASMMSFTPNAPRINFCQLATVFGCVEHGLTAELNSASDCRHVSNASCRLLW